LREGKLVAPLGRRFKSGEDAERAYFVVTAPGAAARPGVAALVDWLRREARGAAGSARAAA
jgi:hypothetical protein